MNSTTQLHITDSGEIDSQPLTTDGEPLWSPSTVQEGLFETAAFEQMPGQLPIRRKDAPESWPGSHDGYDQRGLS